MDTLKAKLSKLENDNLKVKTSPESNLKDENMRLKRELRDLQIAHDELDEFKKALQN